MVDLTAPDGKEKSLGALACWTRPDQRRKRQNSIKIDDLKSAARARRT
jgi:hypothetical protein